MDFDIFETYETTVVKFDKYSKEKKTTTSTLVGDTLTIVEETTSVVEQMTTDITYTRKKTTQQKLIEEERIAWIIDNI